MVFGLREDRKCYISRPDPRQQEAADAAIEAVADEGSRSGNEREAEDDDGRRGPDDCAGCGERAATGTGRGCLMAVRRSILFHLLTVNLFSPCLVVFSSPALCLSSHTRTGAIFQVPVLNKT